VDFKPKFREFEGKIDGFEGSVGEERVCGQRKEAEEEKFIEKAKQGDDL